MKVIIAGSRHISDQTAVDEAMATAALFGITPTEVVCGMARGVDTLGRNWGRNRGLVIKPFPARWREPDGTYNPGAGHERNSRMAEYADALVALWDGQSTGTADMIKKARLKGLDVWVQPWRPSTPSDPHQ